MEPAFTDSLRARYFRCTKMYSWAEQARKHLALADALVSAGVRATSGSGTR